MSDLPAPRPPERPPPPASAIRRALARARDGKALDPGEAATLLHARGEQLATLLGARRAGPRRGARRRRAPRRHHLFAQGFHPADPALPGPLRLLHLRDRARPAGEPLPVPGRGAGHRPPGCRPRLQGGAVHARRPAGGPLAAGAGVAGRQRLRRHAVLRPGDGRPGAGGDRAAAAPEPGRAHLAGLRPAQAGGAVDGDDAGDHRDPAVHRPGRPALRQPGQGPGGAAAGAGGRGPVGGPVHHRHPDRHRGDAGRAGGLDLRHPAGRAGVRRDPGSHRPELPGQTGHEDARHARRRARRPGRDDRGGPAGARPVGADPGPAQPDRRRLSAHPGRRDRRLGRGLAADAGPRQPRAAVAADRRAGPAHRGGRDGAAGAAHDLPAVPRRALAGSPAGRSRGGAGRPGRPGWPGTARCRAACPWQEPDGGWGDVVRPDGPARHHRHHRADVRPPRRLHRGLRRLGRGGGPDRPRAARADPAQGDDHPGRSHGSGRAARAGRQPFGIRRGRPGQGGGGRAEAAARRGGRGAAGGRA